MALSRQYWPRAANWQCCAVIRGCVLGMWRLAACHADTTAGETWYVGSRHTESYTRPHLSGTAGGHTSSLRHALLQPGSSGRYPKVQRKDEKAVNANFTIWLMCDPVVSRAFVFTPVLAPGHTEGVCSSETKWKVSEMKTANIKQLFSRYHRSAFTAHWRRGAIRERQSININHSILSFHHEVTYRAL